jgi:hypothetical protein
MAVFPPSLLETCGRTEPARQLNVGGLIAHARRHHDDFFDNSALRQRAAEQDRRLLKNEQL